MKPAAFLVILLGILFPRFWCEMVHPDAVTSDGVSYL